MQQSTKLYGLEGLRGHLVRRSVSLMNYRELTDTAHPFPVDVTPYSLWDVAKQVKMPLEAVARHGREVGMPFGIARLTEKQYTFLVDSLSNSPDAGDFNYDMTANYF